VSATAETRSNKRVFQVLLQHAKRHKREFAVIGLFSCLYTVADLIQPLIYRRAINDVTGLLIPPGTITNIPSRTPQETLTTLFAAVVLLFVISVVGYYFALRARLHDARVASRIESSLIVDTFGHVLRLPLSFFSRRASAGLAKRIDQCDQVSPIVTAFSQQIAPEAIRFVGICAIMLTQNWEMALVSTCMLPLYLWVARRSALKLRSNLEAYYDLWEGISARITDAISAIKTVKLSGAESREEHRLRQESRHAYGVYLNRVETAQRYYISQSVLSNLSKSLVLGFGGWLVLKHQLTPGDVVMFVAYLDRLYGPIDSLNEIAVTLQNNTASLRRAVELSDTPGAEAEGAPLPASGQGLVEFRNVHFGYVEGREVLHGLSLTLQPGSITVLAGPSGAGKTTTADLLLKLYTPWSGDIYLDGHPLSEAGPSAVRAVIGAVSADGAIFRGNLGDNIRYKRPDATDEEVLAAAKAAGLERTLQRLPDGLLTEIGERGVGLSAGERQRVQIARMLVDKPRLLVLDEATANLDYATELEFRYALTHISPRPTMLVIAHRYTMMRDADYVYVLQDGRVGEQGTAAELIARGGWFAQLAEHSGETENDLAPAGAPAP
jgi:ABC-type multidrug transport system fused ATPase/permease subunit